MSQLVRLSSVPLLSRGAMRCISSTTSVKGMSPVAAKPSDGSDDFWVKNKRLDRPVSPYMIYKIQLTSGLSITHRVTGAATGVLLNGLGLWALAAPNSSFPQLVQSIANNVPASIIFTFKAAILGSLVYHTLNGVRHLLWDMGIGFKLRELYLSGYVVVALTALITAVMLMRT